MSYQLPPDLDQRVKAIMSQGGYRIEDDVLRHAMDALDQLEQEKLVRWHNRNETAVRQSSEGLSKPLDDDAVLVRLRQRLAQEGIID